MSLVLVVPDYWHIAASRMWLTDCRYLIQPFLEISDYSFKVGYFNGCVSFGWSRDSSIYWRWHVLSWSNDEISELMGKLWEPNYRKASKPEGNSFHVITLSFVTVASHWLDCCCQLENISSPKKKNPGFKIKIQSLSVLVSVRVMLVSLQAITRPSLKTSAWNIFLFFFFNRAMKLFFFFLFSVWKPEIVLGLGLTLKPFAGNSSWCEVYESVYVWVWTF